MNTTRQLFGGAIQADGLPSTFVDISNLRQVPDHQEVFADEVSEASVIVEILSHDRSLSDADAAAYYFNDMAQANEAAESTIFAQSTVTDSEFAPGVTSGSKCRLIGSQSVFKTKKSETPDQVLVMLVVFRLPSVDSDVLLWLNCPDREQELSGGDFGWERSLITHPGTCGMAAQTMTRFVNTFRIVDWALFG